MTAVWKVPICLQTVVLMSKLFLLKVTACVITSSETMERTCIFVCTSGQVKTLFERVESEQGRLDILVNNAFALGDGDQLKTKFWKQGVSACVKEREVLACTIPSEDIFCAIDGRHDGE